MPNQYTSFQQLKAIYPNEWILLGEPKMKNTEVLGGILLYHSKDKKEVCYIGKDKAVGYQTVTIAFAGELRKHRKIGILRAL